MKKEVKTEEKFIKGMMQRYNKMLDETKQFNKSKGREPFPNDQLARNSDDLLSGYLIPNDENNPGESIYVKYKFSDMKRKGKLKYLSMDFENARKMLDRGIKEKAFNESIEFLEYAKYIKVRQDLGKRFYHLIDRKNSKDTSIKANYHKEKNWTEEDKEGKVIIKKTLEDENINITTLYEQNKEIKKQNEELKEKLEETRKELGDKLDLVLNNQNSQGKDQKELMKEVKLLNAVINKMFLTGFSMEEVNTMYEEAREELEITNLEGTNQYSI